MNGAKVAAAVSANVYIAGAMVVADRGATLVACGVGFLILAVGIHLVDRDG